MNLRKDHYRSFTRTLRTVSFIGSLRVGDDAWAPSAGVARVLASRRSRTLLRQTRKRPIVVAPLGLRRLLCVRSPLTLQITQLLSVDILAR